MEQHPSDHVLRTGSAAEDVRAGLVQQAESDGARRAEKRAAAELTHARMGGGPKERIAPPDFDEPGEPRKSSRRFRRFRRKLVTTLILLLLALAALCFLWFRFKDGLAGAFSPTLHVALPETLLPDAEMGYSAIDFSNAVLGECREKQSLVVLEQDAAVTSQISQELLNIPLFSMAKTIHSYGTGVYTVDLAALRADDIAVDEAAQIVTVTVPHATLSYIDIDIEKTEIEDTKRALLAVGDIKLTQEQQAKLDASIDGALNAQLAAPAVLTKADETALVKVRELLQPVVVAIGKHYLVKVVMA